MIYALVAGQMLVWGVVLAEALQYCLVAVFTFLEALEERVGRMCVCLCIYVTG
jgi:hypothetical protein